MLLNSPFFSFSKTNQFEITTKLTSSETQETIHAKTIITGEEVTLLDINNDAASDIETIIAVSASDSISNNQEGPISTKFNIKEITNGDLSFESSPSMIVTPNKPASMTLYLKGRSMTLNVSAKRL